MYYCYKESRLGPIMSVQSLAQQAGLKIPLNSLFFAEEHEGNVINQEFIKYVLIHRNFPGRGLRKMCTVCNKDGNCLCYLFMIRHFMLDCYWGKEEDYAKLEDWLTLTNAHAS